MELIETIRVGNTLGEGVLWDAASQALWWTDIQERRLHRYDWPKRSMESFSAPERIGSFGLVAGGADIVAAFESGIAMFDPCGGALKWLARLDTDIAGVRFNDGRVDRQGRFWAGTMEESEPRSGRAALYCLDGGGHARKHETGLMISNGICWSPDSSRFYFADSPLRKIFVYDFDSERGVISNRRLFARTPEGAHPDGANVDSEGFLWSAHWGAGRVVRYAPDGTIDSFIAVPTEQPTCVAFGGPDLDLLFVSSAREGLKSDALARQPHAGDVFVYKVSVPGLPDGRFIV